MWAAAKSPIAGIMEERCDQNAIPFVNTKYVIDGRPITQMLKPYGAVNFRQYIESLTNASYTILPRSLFDTKESMLF